MKPKAILFVAAFWAFVAALVGWVFLCVALLPPGEALGAAFAPLAIPISVLVYLIFEDMYP